MTMMIWSSSECGGSYKRSFCDTFSFSDTFSFDMCFDTAEALV
jgi:hypothetical protein